MPNTFIKISTVTVGASGASTIDFTNIPQTFTDLVVKFSFRTSGTGNYSNNRFSFNGSTSSFTSKLLYGDGSSGASANNAVTTAIDYSAYSVANDATTSVFSNGEAYIPNYTSSNNKSISIDAVSETNATGAIQALTAGLWSNTSAITSIKITPSTGNFVQYSTATLYGITKA